MGKKREISLDLLRTISLLAVIFAHTGSGTTTLTGHTLKITHFLNAVILWHVPCYIMISGRFFLDPERVVNLRKLLKQIIRITIALVFWDIIYQTVYYKEGGWGNLNWKGVLASGGLLGPYHFWFLWMIIGLYIITPFLRGIVRYKRLTEAFIILSLIFQFLEMYGEFLPLVGETVNKALDLADVHFVLGYTGYYLLGYYLYKYPPEGWKEYVLYLLGFISLIGTGLFRVYLYDQFKWSANVFLYKSINITLTSTAIFTFFSRHFQVTRVSIQRLIARASETNFGIFLCHVLLIELMKKTFFYHTAINEIVMRCVRTAAVTCIAYILIFSLRKIPKVGHYIT